MTGGHVDAEVPVVVLFLSASIATEEALECPVLGISFLPVLFQQREGTLVEKTDGVMEPCLLQSSFNLRSAKQTFSSTLHTGHLFGHDHKYVWSEERSHLSCKHSSEEPGLQILCQRPLRDWSWLTTEECMQSGIWNWC